MPFWKGTLLVVTYEISNIKLSVGTLAKDWPTALELYSASLEGYPIGCNLENMQYYTVTGYPCEGLANSITGG